MGVRLERKKPRNLLASAAYRLHRLLPLRAEKKLDLMLDLAAVTNRIALEDALAAGLSIWPDNPFLHKHIKPTDRVLEIGCGGGRVLSQLNAAERVGVDYDQSAIETARKLHPELTFIAGEAREYLDAAEPFDVLILSHVLEHIDRPEEFLASIAGRFERVYIEVPDFEWNTLNEIRLMRNRDLIFMDGDHVAEFDRAELESMLRSVGLTAIDSEFRWGFIRYWCRDERVP